jgi:hypothetical protein
VDQPVGVSPRIDGRRRRGDERPVIEPAHRPELLAVGLTSRPPRSVAARAAPDDDRPDDDLDRRIGEAIKADNA